MDAEILGLNLPGIFPQEGFRIDDPRHDIGRDGFRDLAVLQQVGHGLAGIVVPHHLGDHGKMRGNIIPQTIIGFDVQIDHFLDMEDLIRNVIDDIAERLMFFIIIDGDDHVVVFPAPVFVPGQAVADQGAVALDGEIGIYVMKILRVLADPFHHALHRTGLRQLSIPDGKGDFVRYDLPAHLPVKGNRVRVEEGDRKFLLMHVVDGPAHQGMDQTTPGIFRVGGDASDASHIHDIVVNVHFHGINHDHGRQPVLVKPSENIGLLQHGPLGGYEFILLPASLKELIGGHLKGVGEKGVELLQIAVVQLAHPEISLRLQINVGIGRICRGYAFVVIVFLFFHKILFAAL